MEDQQLSLPVFSRATTRSAPRSTWRRGYIFLSTAALTLGGAYEMYQVLEVGGVTVLEAAVLALYAVLFAWIAFSTASTLAGFFRLLLGSRDALGIDPAKPLPIVSSKTAMLFPTFNEDPVQVYSRLQAVYESVNETGMGDRFDWYLLSDTTNPDIWVAEEKCFLEIVQGSGFSRIYYRHRAENTARKAGNIAEWVRQFGGHYDNMIILDADSLMTGDTVVRLVDGMERNPKAALIQTMPVVVNGKTLFARLQQFAGRLYGPLIAAGIAWWHDTEGNYWGHNAIIRVQAFAQSAGLPELQGRKPFGGHILSHDFIEAALMRRGGWTIHMAPSLEGSYEECPPSLIDFAQRDRRWCQGNLQHIAVLPARGLHWISRLHLLTGIGAYLTAPLWLMFLSVGILISLQAQFVRPEYFSREYSLFPQWPAQDPGRAVLVFAGTMAMLMLPKVLAYILLLASSTKRRSFGGGFSVLGGILLETLLSGLLAPVMMMFQSRSVVEIMLGRDSGWNVQRRDNGKVSNGAAIRACILPTVTGVLMAVSAYAVSAPLLLWMAPVVIGLLLSMPITLLTSRGAVFGRVLVTPDDLNPPPVLTRANELARRQSSVTPALTSLSEDCRLLELHTLMLAPKPRRRGLVDVNLAIARAKVEEAENFDEAIQFLSPREVFALIGNKSMLVAFMKQRGGVPTRGQTN